MLAFVFVRGGVLGTGGGDSPHTCAFSLLVGRRLDSVGVRNLICSLLVWPAHYYFFMLLFLSAGVAFLALLSLFPPQQRRHTFLPGRDKIKNWRSTRPLTAAALFNGSFRPIGFDGMDWWRWRVASGGFGLVVRAVRAPACVHACVQYGNNDEWEAATGVQLKAKSRTFVFVDLVGVDRNVVKDMTGIKSNHCFVTAGGFIYMFPTSCTCPPCRGMEYEK